MYHYVLPRCWPHCWPPNLNHGTSSNSLGSPGHVGVSVSFPWGHSPHFRWPGQCAIIEKLQEFEVVKPVVNPWKNSKNNFWTNCWLNLVTGKPTTKWWYTDEHNTDGDNVVYNMNGTPNSQKQSETEMPDHHLAGLCAYRIYQVNCSKHLANPHKPATPRYSDS